MLMKKGVKPQTCRVTIKKMVSAKPADHQTILHLANFWIVIKDRKYKFLNWFLHQWLPKKKKVINLCPRMLEIKTQGVSNSKFFGGEVWGKLYKCVLGSNMPCLVHKYNSIQLPTQYRSYNPKHVSPKGLHT